jgi:membrane-associated phospholipid phosphatase
MPLQIDKYVRDKIEEHHLEFYTHADSYLKWTPYFLIFLLDTVHLQTKHTRKKHIRLVALSEAIQSIITNSLKYTIREQRPMPSLRSNSFPSGHAATCFAGAEILRAELNKTHPVLSYAGYSIAVTTVVLRLYNNKHWLSDIVAGTAIGILSAKLAYIALHKTKRRSMITAMKTERKSNTTNDARPPERTGRER